MFRNSGILSLNDFFVQALHIICSKRWNQCTHFVENATQRPNITFWIVRHVSPNFRACIIRSARLCVTQSFFNNLWNIKISKFCLHISIKKNVCTLKLNMIIVLKWFLTFISLWRIFLSWRALSPLTIYMKMYHIFFSLI